MNPQTLSFEELLERDGRLVYTNRGVSMLPLLREGRDLMIIEKRPPPYHVLDAVLFRRDGVVGRGAYVLHRILRVNPDGTYWIVGDNCVSGETVREDRILGVLTGVVRGGKTLTTDDFRMRLYVNTWCRCWRTRILLLRARALLAACQRRLRK